MRGIRWERTAEGDVGKRRGGGRHYLGVQMWIDFICNPNSGSGSATDRTSGSFGDPKNTIQDHKTNN